MDNKLTQDRYLRNINNPSKQIRDHAIQKI
jgi:hypothetical protein